MLDSLKDELPLINLVLHFVGLIGVPTLIVCTATGKMAHSLKQDCECVSTDNSRI